ncbi:MAG TPA: GntR family transcriptional regulator [Anaerolineales bacterium]|nr:GntR family transcriptional regulator [Anaerolineales bacterium]
MLAPVINTSSRLSQVKEYLLNYIDQNELGHHDQLPSETAIAKILGVSRNTLREAYIELENEGIIIRRHGIGTFVAHAPVIRDSLNDFSPFTQIIRQGGFTPSFQTLAIERDPAPLEVCEALNLPASSKACCIKRIVRADGSPVIFIKDYVGKAVEAANLDWNAFDGNLIQFLSAALDVSLHHMQSHIRASIVDPGLAPYLELPAGTPILSVRSTIFTEENQPVVYSRICFNSDIIELNAVRMIHAKNLARRKDRA